MPDLRANNNNIIIIIIMPDLPAAHSFLHIQDKVGGAGDHEPSPLRIKPLRISEVIGTFLIFMKSE